MQIKRKENEKVTAKLLSVSSVQEDSYISKQSQKYYNLPD